MAETSKEKSTVSADDMAFKNVAIKRINDLSKDNARLKEMVGRKSTQTQRRQSGSASSRIQGLQSLRNTLGRQFMTKLD
jgi:hypothetical protein